MELIVRVAEHTKKELNLRGSSLPVGLKGTSSGAKDLGSCG